MFQRAWKIAQNVQDVGQGKERKMAQVITAFDGERVIVCPKCSCQLFYVVLNDDWMSAKRLECSECGYEIKFVEDE